MLTNMLCQMKQWMKIKIRDENSQSSITRAQYRVDFGSDGMYLVKSVKSGGVILFFCFLSILSFCSLIQQFTINNLTRIPFCHLIICRRSNDKHVYPL